jgi:hypothetical protein
MVAVLQELQQALWAANILAAVVLFLLVVSRRNYRAFPAFTLYLLTNTTLSIWVFLTYKHWGFTSAFFWWFAWSMQVVTLGARALAVGELCKRLLARYKGIWNLAWRILLVCAAGVLIYSWVATKYQWKLALVRAQRGLELAIAAVIVGIFVFMRHYGVEARASDRLMGVGYCLYSCFRAVNNTILERYLDKYVPLWNFLEMVTFLGCLLLWSWAMRERLPEKADEVELLAEGAYGTLTQEINVRLQSLNENLKRLWYPEAKEP